MKDLLAWFFLAVLVALYFVPTICAMFRQHRNSTAIFVLNLLLGWVVVGWIIAMVWAFTDNVYHTEEDDSFFTKKKYKKYRKLRPKRRSNAGPPKNPQRLSNAYRVKNPHDEPEIQVHKPIGFQ